MKQVFFVVVLIKIHFLLQNVMGENGKGFQNCLIQASDLSHHQYEKKKYFFRNMSGSLRNYILLTTFIAINSKKRTDVLASC